MVLWAIVACWSEKDQEADLDGGIGSRPWGEWAGGLVGWWSCIKTINILAVGCKSKSVTESKTVPVMEII